MDSFRRKSHEDFTKQVGYQSILEVICVSISPFILLLLRNMLVVYLGLVLDSFLLNFLFDLACIVFPLIFLLTVFSGYCVHLVILFTLFAVFLCIFWSRKLKAGSSTAYTKLGLVQSRDKVVTVLLLSCLMIMLIDLPICPRRFAKNSSFGLGLMDVGTGLFLSLSSISGSAALFTLSQRTKFWISVYRIVLPSLLIGVIRFVCVSLLGYQSVVEEYGIHWNFFITFALVRFASSVLCTPWVGRLSRTMRTVLCFILSSLFYLMSLSIHINMKSLVRSGLTWPSTESRAKSVVMANAEGILSLPGYLSLYFLCLGYCHSWRQLEQSKLTSKWKICCFVFTHLFLLLFFGGVLYQFGLVHVSRRFASPAYVLLIFFVFCLCTLLSWLLRGLSYSISDTPYSSSALVDVVSSHGMFYFLISNVTTGLVNVFCNTLHFIPSDSVLNRYTGEYSIKWSMLWPQILIAMMYASLTLLLTISYDWKCGKTRTRINLHIIQSVKPILFVSSSK